VQPQQKDSFYKWYAGDAPPWVFWFCFYLFQRKLRAYLGEVANLYRNGSVNSSDDIFDMATATTFQPPADDRNPMATEESNSLLETPAPTKKKNFPKWRRSMVLWLSAAVAIFVTNLVFIVWAYVRAPNDDLILTYNRNLYEGSCSKARSLNAGLHLIINVLSTLLLGGTNYSMQCLLSPTRQEVNKAHSKNAWLDIGVLSVRNLRRISKLRVALWALLGLSALSFHLL
jgi:hypothetical protein